MGEELRIDSSQPGRRYGRVHHTGVRDFPGFRSRWRPNVGMGVTLNRRRPVLGQALSRGYRHSAVLCGDRSCRHQSLDNFTESRF